MGSRIVVGRSHTVCCRIDRMANAKSCVQLAGGMCVGLLVAVLFGHSGMGLPSARVRGKLVLDRRGVVLAS